MTSPNFSVAGAVDLSAFAQRPPTGPPGSAGAPGSVGAPGSPGQGAGGHVFDTTEQTFEADVLQRSMSVPVVIDFWAEWCQPCKQLSPVLERLAEEYAGRFVLAKVDVDANQQLAAAAQVQSIPTVFLALKGQIQPLFMGAYPEAQIRQVLDEVFRVAAENGVTGTADPAAGEPAEEQEQPDQVDDPRYADADSALGQGDLDAAIAAYEKVLAETPGDEIATAGIARAKLVRRVRDLDPRDVRDAAATRLDDAVVQCRAADVDVYAGNADDAFDRLVATVRRVSGDDRNTVREHLLELFTVVGTADPRVLRARSALASALF